MCTQCMCIVCTTRNEFLVPERAIVGKFVRQRIMCKNSQILCENEIGNYFKTEPDLDL